MPLQATVLEELRHAVGRQHVIDDGNDLRIFERDASIEGAVPDAVVLPGTTAEVAAVIKVAATHGIPVVPRGAGTGLSGGAVTIRGGIALQMTRMRRIIEIDPVAQTAVTLRARRPAPSAATLRRTRAVPTACTTASPPTMSWAWRWCSLTGASTG
jgi:hypothetical protein